jgi:hypothetical protein
MELTLHTKVVYAVFAAATMSVVHVCAAYPDAESIPDPRNIKTGRIIPDLSYSDQPYIVKTDDGAWLCCLTTGASHEGQPGQIVITQRSLNQGKTWQDLVQLEPPSGPEASYAVMLKVPSGRVYIFYNHNTDNIREIKCAKSPSFKDGICRRVDSLGHFVFKYSDDHGRTWSDQRYDIPQRLFEIDRTNAYQGKLLFFWTVGRPFTLSGSGYVPLYKCHIGRGFFARNEGVLLMSDNILTESDPARIRWQTLPDGEIGLRTPPGGGPISAEHSYSVLSDGSIYCVYRTIDGHPVFSYSRDKGHTWEPPRYKRYGNGRLMKHPRAANFAWKCENGNYLYWFHNHGGRFVPEREKTDAGYPYSHRNPAWLCGGVEIDSPQGKIIQWSQPEIVLYDDDVSIRMSYPDLVEDAGHYYVTETQKFLARLHRIDKSLVEGLWHQFDHKAIVKDRLVLDLNSKNTAIPAEVPMPALRPFLEARDIDEETRTHDLRSGFSIDVWFTLESLKAGQILLDNRTEWGKGFALQTTERGTLEIILNDEWTENRWDGDPHLLQKNKLHHLVVIVDGGPKIISFIVDGVLCDGGDDRQFGWGRFSPNLRNVAGGRVLRIGLDIKGHIESLRIYDRYLRTSEAIGNFRSGP